MIKTNFRLKIENPFISISVCFLLFSSPFLYSFIYLVFNHFIAVYFYLCVLTSCFILMSFHCCHFSLSHLEWSQGVCLHRVATVSWKGVPYDLQKKYLDLQVLPQKFHLSTLLLLLFLLVWFNKHWMSSGLHPPLQKKKRKRKKRLCNILSRIIKALWFICT